MTTSEYLARCVAAYLQDHKLSRLDLRAALFDMDGTLYDSMPSHADAWMQMCRDNGLTARREEFFLFEGRTGASTLTILFQRQFGHDPSPEQIEELYRQKTVNFRAKGKAPIMPGAEGLTRQCVEQNLRCVLVTGSGQASLLERIEHDFPGVFAHELAVTSHDVSRGKPDPEPYLLAMSRAAVAPEQAIVFENAPLGVRSAADSGAFTVAVVTGPVPREELAAAGASVIFDSMEQCNNLFPELLYLLKGGLT